MDISSSMRKAKELKLGLDQNFGEGKSRICGLPDSILHHILSFLDTKEAVKTSVLSKRWEFLWTCIPKLEFDKDWAWWSDEKQQNFNNFVEKALLLHYSSDIHTFSITYGVPSNGPPPRINSWIYAALRCKVQKMCLDLYFNDCHGSFMLPRHLFACESLKVLELDFFYDLRLPTFVYFPNLKILTLSKVIFMDDNSANQLFSSCPKLEKLFLSGCNWRNVKTVHVSAPMLEHLEISEEDEGVAYEDEYFEYHCCEFMISGPRIKVFRYTGELKNEYCISEAPSLVVAHIYVYSGESTEERQGANRAHKLLCGLANVKDLHISSLTFKILNGAEELVPFLPLFLNLNHLKVFSTGQMYRLDRLDLGCVALLKILHNSPQLKSICFAGGIWLSSDGWLLDQVPLCFLTHLKTIKVEHFKFLEDEDVLNAIKTLIKSARVLEDIDLGYKEKNQNNATFDLFKECIKSNVVFE